MPDDKQNPTHDEHAGHRPSQAEIARNLSGTRTTQEDTHKGHRPAQEGQRPAQAQPGASAGPAASSPGSGVPLKK
jgi:hypothetical protein